MAESTQTETRYFRAMVRPENAAGIFERRDFELVVPVTGSHHALMDAAIVAIREQDFEPSHIVSHSVRHDCL